MHVLVQGLDGEKNSAQLDRLIKVADQFFQSRISKARFFVLYVSDVVDPLSARIASARSQDASSHWSLAIQVKTSNTESIACLLEVPGMSRPVLRQLVKNGPYDRFPRFGSQKKVQKSLLVTHNVTEVRV